MTSGASSPPGRSRPSRSIAHGANCRLAARTYARLCGRSSARAYEGNPPSPPLLGAVADRNGRLVGRGMWLELASIESAEHRALLLPQGQPVRDERPDGPQLSSDQERRSDDPAAPAGVVWG